MSPLWICHADLWDGFKKAEQNEFRWIFFFCFISECGAVSPRGESLDANSWKSLRFFIVQLWGWAATVCCKRKVHLFISWAIVWFVLLLITQRVTPPPRRTEEPMGPEIRRNTGWNWSCLTRIVWCLSWISKTINSVCRNWSKISCSLVPKRSVNFIVHSTHVTDTNMEPSGLRK